LPKRSTITLGELLYGVQKSARRSQNLQAVEQFTARLEVLPFSVKAAAHFGQIRPELARVGLLCGAYDMLIAAHARSEGLVLITNNVREFQRMPGLRIENWAH
jgi:tRNA(fMet)-specific endonuclease VapC